MKTKLELVEGKATADRDNQFAVDDELSCFDRAKRFDHIGEIAGKRLSGFRLQINFVAVAKGDAAKPVPFRFVLPLASDGNFIDRLRFHGRKRRLD